MIDTASFNRAMALWFDLTGLDPNLKGYTWGQYDWVRASERLRESMTLDPSLLTTVLLLDAYSTSYFKQATISIAEFDDDEDKVFDYMAKVREFKKLIRQPEIMQAADDFIEKIRLAMLSYGFDAKAIHSIIDDRAAVAYIRRDALLSSARLRADHFLQGDVEPAVITPVYHEKVFSYWNINSMIDHLCDMPSGISLNLIRDPDELFSFFTIGIRNGANVITLTDVPEYTHPLGRNMSRRPDRAFEERSGKNWFPYQLLNIKYDDEGNPYHDKYRQSKETGLVPHQPKHVDVCHINALEPSQAVWLTLMMDLIVERYWKNPIEAKALSYTGEMIRLEDQHKVLVGAARSNLPVKGYQPLNLPILTIDDVKTGALGEDILGRQRGNFGRNQWAEDRYADLVPQEALNLLTAPDDTVRFLTDDSFKANVFGHGNAVVLADTVKSMNAEEFKSYNFFNRREAIIHKVEPMDATSFGTRERLDADRKFLARHNLAKGIQFEADKEFAARRKEIEDWFKNRVRANADNLLSYAAPDHVHHAGRISPGFDPDKMDRRLYLFAKCEDLNDKDRYRFGRSTWAAVTLYGGSRTYWERGKPKCFVNETAVSWRLLLIPKYAADLALIAGCAVEELPDVLQHWNKEDVYVGNSILDRIDPLEWAFHNPWEKMSFIVGIYLSKRARVKLQKERVTPSDHVERVEGERVVGY